MLKLLRKKGVMKKILWVVAVVIILVFGFLGQAYLLNDSGRPNYAGKIFGKKISVEEFQHNLQHVQIQAMLRYGKNFDKIKQFLDMESQTWDRIILLHDARGKKIHITDQELIETIQNYGFFKREGRFDHLLYNDILRYAFKIKPRDFEEGMRDSLKLTRLYADKTMHMTIPEEEIFEAFKRQNEEAQISYVLFAAENYEDKVLPDELQVKDYYLTHKSEFQLPPTINIEYMRIDYPEEEADTPPSEEPPKVGAREKAEAKIKARKASDDLAKNPDFARVAMENNLVIETSGFFSMEQPNLKEGWPFPLIQELFERQTGYISQSVETPQGYQILRIKEKKDTYIPEYPQAKQNAKKAWTGHEAKKLSKQDGVKYLEIFREAFQKRKRPDFAKIAKTKKLEIHQTPVFTRGQYLPDIGISKDFQETAFSLTEDNKLSDVVEVSTGHCILHLDSLVPVDKEEYEKQKEEFTQTLLTEKKNIAFNNFLSQLRVKANLYDNIP